MRASPELYDAWAAVLAYPDEDGRELASSGISRLRSDEAAGCEELLPLVDFLSATHAGDREEQYTHTFDGNDVRALEIGWHLHGENYARGALMGRIRKLLGELGLVEANELPDHLGVMLGLLGRLDAERADALVRGVVLPALVKLEEGFADENDPYRGVIVGMRRFLTEHHDEGCNGGTR